MISQKLFNLTRYIEAKHDDKGLRWENIVAHLHDLVGQVRHLEASAVDPSERTAPPADVVEMASFLYANKTRRGMIRPDDGGDAA